MTVSEYFDRLEEHANSDGGIPFQEFMKMTDAEYRCWCRDPDRYITKYLTE